MPDRALPRDRPVLLFDGDCAFCTACVRFAERRIRARADLVPFQFADLGAFGTTRERASREVVWVTPAGRAYGGAQAVAMLLLAGTPAWRPAGALLRVPPFRYVGHVAYRLIARFRHRLPGGTAACALPPARPGTGRRIGRPGD